MVLAIFDYLSLLRTATLEPYHFSEISAMSKVSFRFREKSQPHTFASTVSLNLAEPRPPHWILSGKIVREWDESQVREVLRSLVPESSRVMVLAKEHDPEVVKPSGDLKWETEKWYGTKYYVRKFNEGFLEKVCLFFRTTSSHAQNSSPRLRCRTRSKSCTCPSQIRISRRISRSTNMIPQRCDCYHPTWE